LCIFIPWCISMSTFIFPCYMSVHSECSCWMFVPRDQT
jgi:hypothetical protein